MENPVDPTVERLEKRLRGARWLNLGLALVIALLAGVLLAGGGRNPVLAPMVSASPSVPASEPPAQTQPPASAEPGEPVDIVRRDPADTLAIGDIDAPVVLSEWADLRCPYCARVTTEIMPTLIAEYVDTGKVRIEFHDVSFFGEDSTAAAVALRAAAEQGRFAEYLHTVHAAAPPEGGHPDMPRETLVEFAVTAGVADIDRFTADLDREDLRTAVEASTAWSQQLGISSVPFFVAGNQAISGAQPIEVFRQLLDEQLAAA
ncbi:MAG: thioredoxin domain-containing protein [Propionicimonas sp.]